MEEKIIKILNILKKFSIDDIALYLEAEPEEIISHIERLITKGYVNKISDSEYVYIVNKNADMQRKLKKKTIETTLNLEMNSDEIFNLENFRDFPAEKVFKRKADLEYYNKSDERTKKLLIKHVVLFNLAGNMQFSALKKYLKTISDKYPEYQMNAQWYLIKYKRYLKEGLAGLYRNKMSTIDNKVYEDFKELYLSPKGYTQEQCYEMLLAKGYKEDEIPTLPTFSHRLRQEYPKDAIKKLRTHKKKAANSKDVEFLNIYKKRKKPNEINFEIAAQDYWNAIINNEIETCKTQKYFIQKLIKYFNGIKLGEIVKDKIFEFRDSLIAEGFSLNTIKILLSLLFTILRVSGIIVDFSIYQEIRHSCKLYSLEEIKEIILQDSPKAWIIILGLRLSELQALKYEDINFETQIITIRRRNEYGKIREFKSKKFIREIKCPQLLLDRLKHTNCGYIFEKINLPEYESCLYAHIMLLQAQNVPLNIITKEMGYESINSFYCTFYYLFPNKLENDFNILKPLNL